jgi:hypothetical protein
VEESGYSSIKPPVRKKLYQVEISDVQILFNSIVELEKEIVTGFLGPSMLFKSATGLKLSCRHGVNAETPSTSQLAGGNPENQVL